jgi:ribosomal-protein-alanine N-acetyltransferase
MNPFKQPFHPKLSELQTPRLRIRVDTEEGYIARFAAATDSELMTEFGFATQEELELQRLKIAGGFSSYRTSNVFFTLVERSSGAAIGAIAFHNWYQQHRRSEIGYSMSAEARKGQGLMKEALPAVLEFGFNAMDLNRIEAFISPTNIPSRRLVEGAGFRLEGELREHYTHQGRRDNSVVYGLLLSDLRPEESGQTD